MPVDCNIVLSEMLNAAPVQVAAIEQQIAQTQEQRDAFAEKAAAVEECITDVAAAELRAYLEGPKLAEVLLTFPLAYLVIGPTYGTIGYGTGNITDWEYRVDQPIPPPPLPPPVPAYFVVYSYIPGDDAYIDKRVSDYDFGNDYITHPLGIGAAYGLEPLKDAYDDALSTLTSNQNKIESSIDVIKGYLNL